MDPIYSINHFLLPEGLLRVVVSHEVDVVCHQRNLEQLVRLGVPLSPVELLRGHHRVGQHQVRLLLDRASKEVSRRFHNQGECPLKLLVGYNLCTSI